MELKYRLAISLIKHYEGFSSKMYLCSAGVPSIGYGRTTGDLISPTTPELEEAWLLQYLYTTNRQINQLVPVTKLAPNQMAALFSLSYNIGMQAFKDSTLRKRLNEGNLEEAALEILRWNKIGNKVSAGLTRRRQAEYKLFKGNQ